MSTYTVFWSIDVELEDGATVEDHARHAAELCQRIDPDDPDGASVFYVAVNGGKAARLLRAAGRHATMVDLVPGRRA